MSIKMPRSPQPSPLLEHMYTRFRELFGQPTTMLEFDSQWTLRPDSDPMAPAIFLLVNGSYEKPAVWIFDPYDGGENVWRTAVEAEDQVDRILGEIKARVAAASQSWNNGDGHARNNGDGHARNDGDGHSKPSPKQ